MTGIIRKARTAARSASADSAADSGYLEKVNACLERFLNPPADERPEGYQPPVIATWFPSEDFTLVDWDRTLDVPAWYVLRSSDAKPVHLRVGVGDTQQLEVVESWSTTTTDGSTFWQTHGSFRSLAELGRYLGARTDIGPRPMR